MFLWLLTLYAMFPSPICYRKYMGVVRGQHGALCRQSQYFQYILRKTCNTGLVFTLCKFPFFFRIKPSKQKRMYYNILRSSEGSWLIIPVRELFGRIVLLHLSLFSSFTHSIHFLVSNGLEIDGGFQNHHLSSNANHRRLVKVKETKVV